MLKRILTSEVRNIIVVLLLQERKGEGALAQALGLGLELLELALRQPAELEDEAAGGGALAAVDMAADHDGEVLLLRVRRHRAQERGCKGSGPWRSMGAGTLNLEPTGLQ